MNHSKPVLTIRLTVDQAYAIAALLVLLISGSLFYAFDGLKLLEPETPVAAVANTAAPTATSTPTSTATAMPRPTRVPVTPLPVERQETLDVAAKKPVQVAVAQPAAEPVATGRHIPAKLRIPAIGLEVMVDVTQPKQVGTTPDNQPIFEFTVPRHTAGWDANFGAPGEDGRNVSLAGHVFRFFNDPSTTFDEAKIPAPFAQLKKLQGQKGVDAYVDTIDGMTFHYTLSQDFWAVPDQADLLFDDGQTKLTLVSCIGEQTDQSRADDVELSHRLILIFVPAK